ncbi:MAG: RecX family transcriptional regulator [Lachnospiraceae bacterium]|nr:RecX family transcriptional regulator [Lachnospiraceae bacterium]
MIVTAIEEFKKARKKIDIDGEFAFVLYSSEIRKLHLKVDEEISEEEYLMITTELLPKRAKLRAMNLLQSKTYTTKQLTEKLREALYPEEIVQEAISYVTSYHYLDDHRYAREYILYRSEAKSRGRIKQDLMQKGISKEVIEQAYEEALEEDHLPEEIALIKKELKKKHYDAATATYEEKQKLAASLFRKGFSTDKIFQALDDPDR